MRRLLVAAALALPVFVALALPGARATTDIRQWPLQTLLVTDMTANDEQIPHGVPTYYDWYDKPVVHDATDVHRYAFGNPWGQVYDAATGAPAPLDRVEVRDLQEWYLSRSTDRWVPLYHGNVAPTATVTASSENAAYGQQAAAAVDGVIAGWPADPTAEWATVGGRAGSWLKLAWATPHTLDKVTLYDRPNLLDQVTGGTLTFSDGTTVPVPALHNDGTATTVTFPPLTTSSVLFTATSVSASTQNVGLAEIQVDASTPPPLGGALFPESFQGASTCGGYDNTTIPGSILISPNVACGGAQVSGYLWHFYPAVARAPIADPSDIEAIAVSARVRLAQDNPAGPPPEYVANVGADFWQTATGSANSGSGEGRMVTVQPGWRLLTYTTETPAQIQSNPPPPITADPAEMY